MAINVARIIAQPISTLKSDFALSSCAAFDHRINSTGAPAARHTAAIIERFACNESLLFKFVALPDATKL